MSEYIFIHLPHGVDLRLGRRAAHRLSGQELVDLCWRLYPDTKQSDRVYWALRSASAANNESRIPFANVQNHSNDEAFTWLSDKRLGEYNLKTSSFFFCPRIYPEGFHQLQSATVVELLFRSIIRSVYDDELKFTDKAKDILAGYALQAYIGNYRNEHESRSALRRHYLVKIGRDLEYWAESERRAVAHHRKMSGINRGRAITSYIRAAQEQPTYGIQYHRGISDKTDRQWVIGVCFQGLHRYQPGMLEQPEKVFGWKKLENLYYRDRKFSVEVATDQSQGGVKQYSWYGPTKVIKQLWYAAIHAHQFYLQRRNQSKMSSAHFQTKLADLESRLDMGSRLSEDKHPEPEVSLIQTERFEESPETRAKELEAMMILKEKKKQLEDQYYQRVEQLKMVLKKEAELTSIIPGELRKYQNVDDEEWESEMKAKKQLKNIQHTTFKAKHTSTSSSTPTSPSSTGSTSHTTTKSAGTVSDHALDELRRVEKDLEINAKIAECLSKLNSRDKVRNRGSKSTSGEYERRKYVKRHQEQLHHKYRKKIQSLEETKHSLEMLVRNVGYQQHHHHEENLHAKSIRTNSTSNSSSSLNIDVEIQHRASSGVATPTSNQSTSSLIEDNHSDNPPPYSSLTDSSSSNLTRQYSLRNSREESRPVVTTREDDPIESYPAMPPPPPVMERTTSLTPVLPRRVSQPLVDISAENITLRTKSKEQKESKTSGGCAPLKPDHQRIQITSQKQIESRYCRKHRDLRKHSTVDNTNSNSNIALDEQNYYHQGYGVMPKFPTPLDTLSESSFASDSPHFQNKVQIRQLLKDHFRDHIREHQKRSVTSSTSTATNNSSSTLSRLPRSRSNTSSAQQSADSAFGTDIDFDNVRSAPSTPGSSKRQIPTSLSLNPIQAYHDPGTPTSIASGSTGFQSSSLQSSTSLSGLGYDEQMATTKRKEVRPGNAFTSSTTGLRLALRRVQSQESALNHDHHHHHHQPIIATDTTTAAANQPPGTLRSQQSASEWMLEERGTLV